jgi:hypothetical protein
MRLLLRADESTLGSRPHNRLDLCQAGLGLLGAEPRDRELDGGASYSAGRARHAILLTYKVLSDHDLAREDPMTPFDHEKLEELREAFEFNDLDGDGSMELGEFREMLRNLDSGMSAAETAAGFAAIDANHDGVIDFDEFLAWWREH